MGFIATSTEIGDSALETGVFQLKIAKVILRFLTELVTKPSAWTYETSAGGTVSAGLAKFISYTPVRDNIWLHRGERRIRLELVAPVGIGVGVSGPWQIVSTTLTTSDFHSTGYLGIPPFVPDFETTQDFNGPGVIFNIDANLLVVGKSISILMFGVNPWGITLVRRIAKHHRELVALLAERPPETFLSSMRDKITRPPRVAAKLAEIHVEVTTLVLMAATALKFRGILFMEGFEASVCAHPPWITLAVGISLAIGVVEGVEE